MSDESIVENLLLTPVPPDDAGPIVVGSPAWFAWLGSATRFRLATPQGLVTVRKEQAGGGRGSWYWRAYRKRHGRLHRYYLGPDVALTPEALTAVSAALGTLPTMAREHGPLPTVVPNTEGNGSEADGASRLLQTKVAPPTLRPGLVARPALVTRLRAGTTAALTLLIAPAGFGKTTLLAQTFTSVPDVAWLTLERSDDAPRDFLVALCAAMARVRPAILSRASVLLQLPARADATRVLDLLLGDLADCAEPCIIVLDDYHVLENQVVHQLVARLVEHAPPALRLIIASRTEPALPLARLRARGLLAELHDRELRFGLADAARLLRSASRQALSDADARTLTARTEGWAAGLQLAALALSTAANPARVIAAFSGEHRLVADYLLSEVLAELPARLRRFLRATAILERLSASLCAAVWDDGNGSRADVQQVLEELERRGLFLTPLDDTRCWYRYHQLVAELLRAELERVERPETIAALHLRAAAWYLTQLPTEGNVALEAAIGHSLVGGAPARAAELVERAGLQAVFTGEAETLQRWLRALPSSAVQARPFLRLAAAGHFPQLRHPQIVAQELASLGAPAMVGRNDAIRDAMREATAGAEALGVRAFVAQACGDLEQAATLLLEALALLPTTEQGLRWRLLVSLGNAYALEGWLVAAHLVLSASLDAAGDDPVLSYLSQSYRAWVSLSMGWVEPAQRTFADLCARAEAAGWGDLPLMGEALLGLGAARAESGQLREGLALLERGLALMRRMGFNALLIPGELERARVCRALGRVAEAHAAVATATMVARDFAAPFLQARIQAARLDLGLDAAGELPLTSAVARYAEVPVRLAWARAAIGEGRAREARAVLAPLLPIAEQRRWGWALLTARVLWARACSAEQDGGTHDAVGAVVAQIASEGSLLPLLEEGPAGVALIQGVATLEHPGLPGGHGAVQLVIDMLAAPGVQAWVRSDGHASADAAREPLTPREQEVLALIASGASNAEIAAQLVVTIGTVKAHSRSLFGKLGVVNRTQAARLYHLARRTSENGEIRI